MLPRPASAITPEHIKALVDNNRIETKEIDYKQELSKSPDHKIKFLKETTSFANTRGGHLVLGVAERDDGLELHGLDLDNKEIDIEINGWENILESCVRPRLPGHEIIHLDVEGKDVLVIQVLESSLAPHRVEIDGHKEFYGRNSNGSYPLDVDEIRETV